MYYEGNTSLKISRNSEAIPSEFLENFEHKSWTMLLEYEQMIV